MPSVSLNRANEEGPEFLNTASLTTPKLAEEYSPSAPCRVHLCETVNSNIKGRRSHGFNLVESHVLPFYTWDGANRSWRTDSMCLGLTDNGIQALKRLEARLSPIERSDLDVLMRTALLSNCTDEPKHFLEMLGHYPGMPRERRECAISSPVPLYHASGFSKDVFLGLAMCLPAAEHLHAIELALAIKVGKESASISSDEMSFHRRLYEIRPLRSPVSQFLGSIDLSTVNGLDMAGRILTVERFEAGPTAEELIAQGRYLATALAVTRGAFDLIDTAIACGFGRRAYENNLCPLPSGHLMEVRFPSDINPGNFVIGRQGQAILVDVGRHHPHHTFSQVMLRLINPYWHVSDASRGDKGACLPLAPLFESVIQHFGKALGHKLLSEFAATIGFIRGSPITGLRAAFPSCPVDKIGMSLRRMYVDSTEDFGGLYISRAIRASRTQFFEAERSSSDIQEQQRVRYAQGKNIVHFFGDAQLRKIYQELTEFLFTTNRQEFRKKTERQFLSAISSQKLSIGPQLALKAELPPTRSRNSALRGKGPGLIAGGMLVSPFPDANVVKLAMETTSLGGYRDNFHGNPDLVRKYLVSVLGTAVALREMFKEREFTANLVIISKFLLHPIFLKHRLDLRNHGNLRGPRHIQMFEQWLGVFVALSDLYGRGGISALQLVADRGLAIAQELPALVISGLDDIVPFFARFIPEHYPPESGLQTLGPKAKIAIKDGAKELHEITTRKHPPRVVHRLPQFAIIAPRESSTIRRDFKEEGSDAAQILND